MGVADDERVLLKDSHAFPLSTVIYDGVCPDCEEPLYFEMDPDPDSPSYTAKCEPCNNWVTARPSVFRVSVTDV